MNNPPRVTVLMTVYNGLPYLPEAVASIFAQTFRDFELLIINDGSTDASLAHLQSLPDERTRIVDQQPNRGIRATLNHGLTLARGEFIAIMDQDDIALPARLARQIAFLDEHPSVGLCGTAIEVFGPRGGTSWVRHFAPEAVKLALLFENPICHPSVMLRRRPLADNGIEYPDFPYAEEYALWVRLSRVCALANLPEVLLRYRQHDQQISRRRSQLQCRSADRIVALQLVELGVPVTARDMILHRMLGPVFNPLPGFRRRLERYVARLLDGNSRTNLYPADLFRKHLTERQVATLELQRTRLAALSPMRRLHWTLAVWWDFLRADTSILL